jgi:anti-sigma regulatory factor (Ser/Thr protein kinase)
MTRRVPDQSSRHDCKSTEDASIGGLGVILVRELTDEQLYRREDGTNRFCVLKDLP